MSTTIKIKRKTLVELTKIAGELTMLLGRRLSYDEVIQYLIKKYHEDKVREQSDKATKLLLSMIEKPVECGGPEDFREYEYEGIGE